VTTIHFDYPLLNIWGTGLLIDLISTDFINNPYAAYRELRGKSEPTWMPHQIDNGAEGIWLFSRYKDVATILRETRSISKDKSHLLPAGQLNALDRMLLNMDPPGHTRLRAMIAPWFGVRRMAEMKVGIERLVRELLSNIKPGEKVEFIESFALNLPLLVIAGILGVPAGDMVQMKRWTDVLISSVDSGLSNEEIRNLQADSMRALTEYLSNLIAAQKPGDENLIAHLNRSTDPARSPTKDEILGLSVLIVLAGYETTVNLLGNGLLTLLLHPQQMQHLRANSGLLNNAIDEMLRFESPLQRSTYRVTTREFHLNGFTLEPGQQVSAVIGAANRDPGQFANAEVFDITRTPNPHLAFGLGIHKCLGERLARLEAHAAFSMLLEKFRHIELADAKPHWQEKTLFRGLKTLNIYLDNKTI